MLNLPYMLQRGIETALNAKDDDLMVEILGIIVHKGSVTITKASQTSENRI